MFQFRTATVEDAHELEQLINSAYRGEYSKHGWTTEADLLEGRRTSAAELIQLILSPGSQIEIAIDSTSNRWVGSVFLRSEPPLTLYFGMLTVEPKLQARGIGKLLLQHVESIAQARGFHNLRMSVIPARVELVEFYRRRGFQETGRIEDFPKDDPEFSRSKVEGLCLAEYVKPLSWVGLK